MRRSQFINNWEHVQSQIAHCDLVLKGHVLSEKDRVRLANAYVLWALVIQDCCSRWGLERDASDANLTLWLDQLRCLDVDDVVSHLKEELGALRHFPADQAGRGRRSVQHFKHAASELSSHEPWFSFPWRGLRNLWLRTGDLRVCRDYNTVLQFITKLTLKDIDFLENEMIEDYRQFEQELPATIASMPDSLINELRDVVAFHYDGLYRYLNCNYPSHGNGATVNVKRGAGIVAKEYEVWQELDELVRYIRNNPDGDVEEYRELNRPAVLMTVPKSLNKKRTISIESASKQLLQHALFENMDDYFRDHPELGIDLHDQGHNRKLCVNKASRNYGTIDLSSASDSVTTELLMRVLPPLVRPAFMKVRSDYVKFPDDSLMRVSKFAGMGNAVTFACECMLFSAIVLLAQRRVGVDTYFRVYGDDIVVHKSCYEEVCYLLKQFGFKVNVEKSFPPECSFKESCGEETMLGVSIAPVRISRGLDVYDLYSKKPRMSTKTYASTVKLCNELLDAGFTRARRYLLRRCVVCMPHSLFFGEEGMHTTVRNIAYKRVSRMRWNNSLQRYEVRSLVPYSRCSRTNDEEAEYQITLEKYRHTERTQLLLPDDYVCQLGGPTKSVFRWTWCPV